MQEKNLGKTGPSLYSHPTMPFIRNDPEMYDEIASELGDELPEGMERPSGEFEYESAEARFKPEKLSPIAKLTLDAMRALAATRFRVRYDGGYDEGFSHPDAVGTADGLLDAQAFADEKLASEAFSSQVRASAQAQQPPGVWGGGSGSDWYRQASDQQVARSALDELAHALATRLLGDGFGTGEYQLYGAFTADLRSGEITDDQDVAKPSEME
jgi:hypothetical protein